MEDNIRRYVLTGGLCVGKTTTLTELAKRGFYTTIEIGRIIQRYKIHPKNFITLAVEVGKLIPQGIDIIFMDRGAIDTLAFIRAFGKTIPPEYYEICRQNRYNEVFLLEMLPNYVQDCYRIYPRKMSKKIEKLIIELYTEFGYNLIYVPAMSSVEARADFILEKLSLK